MFAIDHLRGCTGAAQNINRNAPATSSFCARTSPSATILKCLMKAAHSTCRHNDRFAKHSCRRNGTRKPQLGSHTNSSSIISSRPCLSNSSGISFNGRAKLSAHRPRHGRRDVLIANSSTAGKDSSGKAEPPPSLLQSILKVVNAQILPILLITAMTVGSCCPSLGAAAAKTSLATYTTTAVFVLAGLSIKRGEAQEAFKYSGALSYGLIAILLLTPATSLIMARLPLQPAGLALGLAVFALMPTTLSSGITLTQAAGANVALALLLTITSNLLSVFTLPFTLPALLGLGTGLVLDPFTLLLQLMRTVLLPTAVGAVIRATVPAIRDLVDNNKQVYSYLTAGCLAVVPWMQVSKAVSQNLQISMAAVGCAAMAGILMHCAFLAFNTAAAKVLSLGGSDPVTRRRTSIPVILLSSGKTLPVAVAVLSSLSGSLGDAVVGPAAIACVAAHLGQILVDSLLVSHWRAQELRNPGGW